MSRLARALRPIFWPGSVPTSQARKFLDCGSCGTLHHSSSSSTLYQARNAVVRVIQRRTLTRWCALDQAEVGTRDSRTRSRRPWSHWLLSASGGLVGVLSAAALVDIDGSPRKWLERARSFVFQHANAATTPLANSEPNTQSAPPAATEVAPADKPLTRFAIADAAARVAPAVVNITVTMSTGERWIFGPFAPPTTLAQSTGSGFIFDSKEGLVLTNAHVVAEMRNAPQTSEMTITLQDGRSFPGAVESVDALTDLSIVRILEAGTDLPAAELGSSSSLRTGEWVIAVGSPLMLANTVTCGIVSATNREGFEIGFPVGAPRLAFIQTDAAINIGNSGGPLVNLDGQVIGINTLKALSSDGISFALPIDLAKEVIQQLRQHGRVVRPFLGLKLITLTPALAEELRKRSSTGFPADLHEGVCVPQVLPGGPADRGGLRAGDVVIAVDGKPVRSTRDILDMLGNRIGKPIEFTVIRGKRGQRVTLQVIPEQAKA
ncbi:hypothetical protein CCYA_CCYA16G4053 [Cyanidiococcus yangmingshanensis]|nr:hypothetical protein CCYA_CCYA16G4053 [Cyanidiococcus yangmingshanensis]